MRTQTSLSRTHEINTNINFSWYLKEYKYHYCCRTTRYISIYINDKEILKTKQLSIKTISEINNAQSFERVLFILSREMKFRDEHREVVALIKNIINY